jgi:hypothetical protein
LASMRASSSGVSVVPSGIMLDLGSRGITMKVVDASYAAVSVRRK